jgi:hypothetical protein
MVGRVLAVAVVAALMDTDMGGRTVTGRRGMKRRKDTGKDVV